MKEIVVEGLDEYDFILLKKIIETYPITVSGDVTYNEVEDIYTKVTHILNYLDNDK